MSNYVLTFVVKDRPGIVASVSEILYRNGFNIADSSSANLKGIFSMIFLVHNPKNFSEYQVRAMFSSSDDSIVPMVHFLEHLEEGNDDYPLFAISVYGADKPGIVHEITKTLSHLNINIEELQTEIVKNDDNSIYVMILVVSVKPCTQDGWIDMLNDVARSIGTDITVRNIDVYEF